MPKSPLGEAVGYALSNWAALMRYTEQGYLAIDNNLSERSLRQDQTVRLWSDLDGGQPRVQASAKWHTDRVFAVTFAPNGKALASAGRDGRVILWDTATGAKWHEWLLPGLVHDVTYAADGRHLVIANGNGTAYVLRLPPIAAAAR